MKCCQRWFTSRGCSGCEHLTPEHCKKWLEGFSHSSSCYMELVREHVFAWTRTRRNMISFCGSSLRVLFVQLVLIAGDRKHIFLTSFEHRWARELIRCMDERERASRGRRSIQIRRRNSFTSTYFNRLRDETNGLALSFVQKKFISSSSLVLLVISINPVYVFDVGFEIPVCAGDYSSSALDWRR